MIIGARLAVSSNLEVLLIGRPKGHGQYITNLGCRAPRIVSMSILRMPLVSMIFTVAALQGSRGPLVTGNTIGRGPSVDHRNPSGPHMPLP